MTDAHRKELVFQQSKFLEGAEGHVQEQPWIAFIAALKHIRLLESFQTDTSTFREISDKEYFDGVQHRCLQTLNKSSSLLDGDTKQHCEKLVHIQVFHDDIIAAIDAVTKALALGIRAFEPPMEAPVESFGCGGCLLVIVGAILAGAVAASASEEAAGIGGVVALFVGAAIWSSIMSPKWEKEKKEKKVYTQITSSRSLYYAHVAKFKDLLSFDASAMALDLAMCHAHLASYLSDLKILEDTYIDPYV